MSHPFDPDTLRLKACYGQLRLVARAWAERSMPVDWRSVDFVLAMLAVEVALPGTLGEKRFEAERMLHREPALRPPVRLSPDPQITG